LLTLAAIELLKQRQGVRTIAVYFALGGDMAYTPIPNECGPFLLNRRLEVAYGIIRALECQSGLDTLPAQAALPRILNGVFKRTGFKFKMIGHGRMRDVFDVVSTKYDVIIRNENDLSLVLKLGNKQATVRDIALTLAYPEDRAKIFAASDYGLVAEKVDMIRNLDDPRIKTPEFKARFEDLGTRYVGLTTQDLGFTEDGHIVIVGSSTRVLKVDAAMKGSASQQIRTA